MNPLRRTPTEPPPPESLAVEHILLASEGRSIPADAIDFAARLAKPHGAAVHVFSVARVYGTAFGFPNPGLNPTKREWDEQRANVTSAVKALKRRGLESEGHVLGTRRATKRIVGEAQRLGCGAIVMAADPPRSWLVSDLMWSQEPYRVRRRARVPVYLVPAPPQDAPSRGRRRKR